jgi:hypothetical protein
VTAVLGDGDLIPARQLVQLQACLPSVVQSCSNLMFRKAAWQAAGGFKPAHGPIADHEFKLNLATACPGRFLPQPLFQKRIHADNLFTKSASPLLKWRIAAVGAQYLQRVRGESFEVRHLRAIYRQELLDGLYECRQAGLHRQAAWFAAHYAKVFGCDGTLLRNLTKYPVAVARDLLRSRLAPNRRGT